VRELNPGPLPHRDLLAIFERIMDMMRKIQQEEIAPQPAVTSDATEADQDTED
jgi:hypothetical protein